MKLTCISCGEGEYIFDKEEIQEDGSIKTYWTCSHCGCQHQHSGDAASFEETLKMLADPNYGIEDVEYVEPVDNVAELQSEVDMLKAELESLKAMLASK